MNSYLIVVIWKNESDCNWINPIYVGNGTLKQNGKDVVYAAKTLMAFASFMNSLQFPFEYDFAQGYFEYMSFSLFLFQVWFFIECTFLFFFFSENQ